MDSQPHALDHDQRGHHGGQQAGGGLGAPPITYTVNGRQQIAVAAGSSIISFQLMNAK